MAFWSVKNAAPVQSHKFRVYMNKMKSFTVKSVTKPSLEVTEGVYQVGNHKFKYPGVHTWNDVTIVFVDDKETTRRLIQNLIDQGLCTPNTNIDYNTLAPNTHSGNSNSTAGLCQTQHPRPEHPHRDSLEKGKLGVIRIEQHAVLDYSDHRAGTGTRSKDHILETWHLQQPWIKSISFGQLDYSSDELITLEAVIAYDYCTITYGPAGESPGKH